MNDFPAFSWTPPSPSGQLPPYQFSPPSSLPSQSLTPLGQFPIQGQAPGQIFQGPAGVSNNSVTNLGPASHTPEIIGQHIVNSIHPQLRQIVAQSYAEAAKEGWI